MTPQTPAPAPEATAILTDLLDAIDALAAAHATGPAVRRLAYVWSQPAAIDLVEVIGPGLAPRVTRVPCDPALGAHVAQFIEAGLNRLPADMRPTVADLLARGARVVARVEPDARVVTGQLVAPGVTPCWLFAVADATGAIH